jgi:hypothetical protein
MTEIRPEAIGLALLQYNCLVNRAQNSMNDEIMFHFSHCLIAMGLAIKFF